MSVASWWSSGEGWQKCTPHPAVGDVPYRMLALTNDPSVYMSVRVFRTIGDMSLIGVSWVDASEGGGASSSECADGVLLVLGAGMRGGVGGRGGVVGALNRRGRSPLYETYTIPI